MILTQFPIDKFSGHLFWDTDKRILDIEKSQTFIIQRVLEYGLLSDWHIIKQLYGLPIIKQEALQLRALDDVTLAFLCTLFELPKKDFRCYRLKQSAHNYWNY